MYNLINHHNNSYMYTCRSNNHTCNFHNFNSHQNNTHNYTHKHYSSDIFENYNYPAYRYEMESFYSHDTTGMQQHMNVPPIHGTYQQLLYGDDHEMQSPPVLTDISEQTSRKISQLEKELESVRRERDQLKEEVAKLREAVKGNVNTIATPRKIQFLKDLAAFFEESPAFPTTPKVQPRRSLVLGDIEETSEPEIQLLPQLQSRKGTDCCSQLASSPSSQLASSPYSVTKKVALLPDYQVFVTPQQLSYIKQHATTPRALMIVLLDTLFDRETLSVSCAKGARKAVNKKDPSTNSQPLDASTLAAIKEYTFRVFRDNGKACMKDSEMTDIINSKCASARRSLKKKK